MSGAESGRKDAASRTVRAGAEWQGQSCDASDPAELRQALLAATDYRGDVTLELADGTSLAGYVFHCELAAQEPYVRVLPAGAGDRVAVPVARVRGIRFTGDDKAAGKSWQAWVARWNEKKRLAAQGIDVGDIEPQPEALD